MIKDHKDPSLTIAIAINTGFTKVVQEVMQAHNHPSAGVVSEEYIIRRYINDAAGDIADVIQDPTWIWAN